MVGSQTTIRIPAKGQYCVFWQNVSLGRICIKPPTKTGVGQANPFAIAATKEESLFRSIFSRHVLRHVARRIFRHNASPVSRGDPKSFQQNIGKEKSEALPSPHDKCIGRVKRGTCAKMRRFGDVRVMRDVANELLSRKILIEK